MSSSKNELASDHDNCLNALTVKNAVESGKMMKFPSFART